LALAASGALAVAVWRASQAQPSASDFSTLGRGVDDVRLTDSAGRPVEWGDLKGAPRALFFGFTHCPEICPVTITALSASLDRIGPDGRKLHVAFVTVDPQRDTPEKMGLYLQSFGDQFRGYSGDIKEIDRLVDAFRAHYEKAPPDENGNYNVNHTAIVYLLNSDGQVVDVIGYGVAPERMEAQLRALLGAS
jgi:protein SCO1/2